jgi:quinol monooxygenase YgiN
MPKMFRATLLALTLLLGVTVHSKSVEAADVRMFVRHEVADYAKWLKAYNAFAKERSKMGVRWAAVYRSIDNPNDVTVTHDFKSVEKAKAFAASPRLKQAMSDAGVKGEPQIWLTNNPVGRTLFMPPM